MARPKAVPASAHKHLELKQANSCTWKVVDPNVKTDVPACHGFWGGYRTTKALAWVFDLGYGQWMARCGNEVCNTASLPAAKREARAMAVGGIGDYEVSDPIREYQELSATIEARYSEEFKLAEKPIQRLVAAPPMDRPLALQGDDYPLEYYKNGYPKHPECLDRRRKPEPLVEAA